MPCIPQRQSGKITIYMHFYIYLTQIKMHKYDMHFPRKLHPVQKLIAENTLDFRH